MPPAKQTEGDYVCIEGFGYITKDGAIDNCHAGDVVPAGHPVMKGREWAFKPLAEHGYGRWEKPKPVTRAKPEVEDATADPGTKRGEK